LKGALWRPFQIQKSELLMAVASIEDCLARVPRRTVPFETGEEGRVVLLRPKILSPRWAWLLRMFGKPNYRVKLDQRGSCVWLLCDGARSSAEIAAAVQTRFSDPPQDSATRTLAFLRELQRGGFLEWSGLPGVVLGD
jgi:hypothetical protein